jgi:hypothetical protein
VRRFQGGKNGRPRRFSQHAGGREADFYRCALARLTHHGEDGAVCFGQRLGERQAKPGALADTRGRFDTAEGFQGILHLGVIHADPGIRDAQHHLAAGVHERRDNHLATSISIFDGVGENVEQHLPHGP